jgi:hypothetical protein
VIRGNLIDSHGKPAIEGERDGVSVEGNVTD